jgi:DNA repair protein RecO (recombination protein O)
VERVVLDPSLLLHRRPYRDTSQLLEVLSETHGRIGLVARGRRTAAALQLFQPLLLSWTRRGELGTLGATEVDGPQHRLLGRRAVCGLYMNELLMRCLARDDPHPQVVTAYRVALVTLAAGAEEGDTLRRFELALLDGLGFGLDLAHDATDGEPVSAGSHYRFVPLQGIVRSALSEGAVDGAHLLALAAGDAVESEGRGAIRRIISEALAQLIGDRPLQTRRLLEQPGARPD